MACNNQKGEFVRAMGTEFEIFKRLTDAVYTLGGSDDDLLRVLEKDSLLPAEIARLLVKPKEQAQPKPARPKLVIECEFKLTLDYGVGPADTLRATKCDYIYPWMLEHCPEWQGKGNGEVTVALIDMGGDWERDQALTAIDELGLTPPPDNCALWTLSRVHPDLQRKIWVVDPVCVWTDEDGIPCLAYVYGSPDDRSAYLDWVGVGGRRHFRVLALRK